MSTTSAVSTLTTATDPANATELAKLPGFTRKVKTTLDQSDFLKLLSTQLANQDPLNPQSDLNSIGQMAQFTSAQQMGDLVTSLKSFIVSQDFSSAQNMLGKYVTVSIDKVNKTADGSTVTVTTKTSGLVSAVGYDAAGVSAIKVGDKTYSPSDVSSVSSTAGEALDNQAGGTTDFGTAQTLMGRTVTVTQESSANASTGALITTRVNTKGVVTSFGTDAQGNGTITIGGTVYPLSAVTAVQALARGTSTATAG